MQLSAFWARGRVSLSRMHDAARLFLTNGVVRKAMMAGGWLPLAVRLAVDLDLSATQLLLLGTSMEVAMLFGEIPTGVVADVFSRKWSVVIGSLMIFSAQFASGVVDEWAFYLVTQFVWGLGWTFISGAEIAWVTDEVGSAEAAEPLLLRRGRLEFAATIAAILFFGALAWVIPRGTSVMIAGGLGVLWTLYLAYAMQETGFRRVLTNRRESFVRTVRLGATFTWTHKGLRVFGIALILMGMAAEALDRLDVRRLEDLEMSDQISPVLVFGAVMIGKSLLGGLVLWRFQHRFEGKNVVSGFSAVLVAVAAGTLLLAHVPVLAFVAVVLVAQGGLLNMTAPLIGTWTNALAPPDARATVHSFIGQTRSLGEIAGGISLGAVAAAYTLPVAWTIAAGLFVCAASIAFTARRYWDAPAQTALPPTLTTAPSPNTPPPEQYR